MNKLLLFILLLNLLFSCKNKIIYVSVRDNKIKYKNYMVYYEDKPFTGTLVDSLKGYTCYLTDSVEKCYYLSGELWSIWPIKGFNSVDGFVRYYEKDGTLSEVSQVKDNLRNGYYLEVLDSNKKVEGYYKNNMKDSVWILQNFINNHKAKDNLKYYHRGNLLVDLTSVLLDEMENKPDTQIRYEFDLKDTILRFKFIIDDWKLKSVEKLD